MPEWLNGLLQGNVLWPIVIVLLPIILPYKIVYHFFRLSVGKALKVATLQWAKGKKGFMPIIEYFFDTIVAILEGTVDGIQGKNKYKK